MSRYIPREIMIQILELLPVESLVRFRSVCQWMNGFINSPSFIQHHLALQKPRFIAIYEGREFLVINPHMSSMAAALLARRSESARVNLVGTLHGIVCFYYYKSHFMLCNLSIRKSLILPLPDFKKPAFTDYASEYGYTYDDDDDDDGLDNAENDGSCVFSGFWIDPRTKDFKIVMFSLEGCEIDDLNDVILYSSSEQDWKPIFPPKVRMHPLISQRPAVVIGKVGYWRIFEEVEQYDDEMDDEPWICTQAYIVSFDFESGCFDRIKAPWVYYSLAYPPVLSRWQDTLSLVYVDDLNQCEVYFWEKGVIEEDSWLKMLSFNLTNVTNITHVLSMVESEGQETDLGEELLGNRTILAATSTSLILCDNKPACIPMTNGLTDQYNLAVAYDFVGSLLFPQP